jgi:two-component system CheB/CheR fusion protein
MGEESKRTTAKASRTSNSRKISKENQSASTSNKLVVVGIGASAGGVEALKQFFSIMPAEMGVAFVVVQHLDPSHESMMSNILATCTNMPVAQVTRRQRLKVDHIYVAPPNKYLTISKDQIGPTKPLEERGARMPVNFFFHALAFDKQEAAVGIVLSGTGADGSAGLRSIRENGGLCIAQDPKTAAYSGMPMNAINTGAVDFILPLARIADTLNNYTQHPFVAGGDDSESVASILPDHLDGILALLRTRLRRDFRYYKKSTLIRRVRRRMGIVRKNSLKDYLAMLRKNPGELDKLYGDILIGVTQFFRDPAVFKVLAKDIIPQIVENCANRPIRVWVPGCSTGEEAYTVAMLLLEEITAKKLNNDLMVFATDIDPKALEKARNGIFPQSIEADVSPQRLRRFFTKDGDRYRAVKQLRETIAFAEQNLISDPPISKLDLISCRNLLIYVEPELQKKIIALFHYTLNDDGFMLLGTSETVGRQRNLFAMVDKKAKIYQRINHAKPQQVDFPILASEEKKVAHRAEVNHLSKPNHIVFSELTHRLLSEAYAPAAVLINRTGEPLYYFGSTDRFLKLPTGDAHQDIVAMARSGLATKLRGLVGKAVRSNEAVSLKTVTINTGGGTIKASIRVNPVLAPKDARGLFLVTFLEKDEPVTESDSIEEVNAIDGDITEVEALARELQITREDLQSTIEEMETSNEELKAANEEAMSMNEELQSTNEELETSKEEMQSLNEELNTVNSELEEKIEQLEASRNDVANLLISTSIATLFLDHNLRIKRLTPAISELINITQSDAGRKLSDFTSILDDPDLLADCETVFKKLLPIERETKSNDGRWLVRRILPYRTEEDKIEGVVITFTDVTTIKKAEAEAQLLAAIVRDSNDAVILQGPNGQILAWNLGAEKMYGYTEAEALKMNVRNLVPKGEKRAARDFARQVAEDGEGGVLFAKRLTKTNQTLDVSITASALSHSGMDNTVVATTERDVTAMLKLQNELQTSHDELEIRVNERSKELQDTIGELHLARDDATAANEAKTEFLAAMSHDLRTPLNAIIGFSEMMMAHTFGPIGDVRYEGYVADISRSGSLLLSLINDVLDLSKIEAQKYVLHEKDIEIAKLIDESISQNLAAFGKIKQTISVSIPDDFPNLRGDERALTQILNNLLSNALKFSPENSEIAIRVKLDQADAILIEVADEGIGIAAKDLALIDQPFSQVESQHTRRHEGTGLGLYLVLRLMKLHGGTKKIDSKPNKGTTVTVRFPPERTIHAA